MLELVKAEGGWPGCREVTGLHIATVRHFADDTSAAKALAAAGLPALPAPGSLLGCDPWLAWRGPQESILVATHRPPVDALLEALAVGQSDTAMTAELSEALITFELHGQGVEDWLGHLVDASAIPQQRGRASRARMADVPVFILRLDTELTWLLGDRPVAAYLRNWLTFSHKGAFHAMRRDEPERQGASVIEAGSSRAHEPFSPTESDNGFATPLASPVPAGRP